MNCVPFVKCGMSEAPSSWAGVVGAASVVGEAGVMSDCCWNARCISSIFGLIWASERLGKGLGALTRLCTASEGALLDISTSVGGLAATLREVSGASSGVESAIVSRSKGVSYLRL